MALLWQKSKHYSKVAFFFFPTGNANQMGCTYSLMFIFRVVDLQQCTYVCIDVPKKVYSPKWDYSLSHGVCILYKVVYCSWGIRRNIKQSSCVQGSHSFVWDPDNSQAVQILCKLGDYNTPGTRGGRETLIWPRRVVAFTLGHEDTSHIGGLG